MGYPIFPLPNQGMNQALEGTEQQELENEMLDSQGQQDDLLPKTDQGGAETKLASEETLEGNSST